MALDVLEALDFVRTQSNHITAITIARMGFFTDAYNIFCISTISKLLSRLYYTVVAPNWYSHRPPILRLCQVLRLQDLNVLELQCVILANHDQNLESRFRLLKVCLCVKLESSNCRKLLFNFCKARSIENQTRSTETCANCFFCSISNSAQAHMTCRVLYFALSIKGKTLSTFQRLLICCVCESLMRSRGIYLYTHLGLSRSRLMSRTR